MDKPVIFFIRYSCFLRVLLNSYNFRAQVCIDFIQHFPDYRFNHAAFRPARMTPDELTEAAWACRRQWSSRSSIVRRALDLHTNLATPFRFATYVVYNPLFRREAFKRQGMRLGTR